MNPCMSFLLLIFGHHSSLPTLIRISVIPPHFTAGWTMRGHRPAFDFEMLLLTLGHCKGPMALPAEKNLFVHLTSTPTSSVKSRNIADILRLPFANG